MGLVEAGRYPGRLLVYLVFNANHDAAAGMADLADHYRDPWVIGIKLHPGSHHAPTDDPRYHPAYEFAREHGLPVLVHTWGIPDVRGLENMARQYPSVRIIAGHSGGYEFAANREAMRASRQNDNLFLDLALSGMFEGVIEAYVREAGEEKVLFGSDMPFFDPRPAIGRVAFARITDAQKEKILGENMRRILGKPRNT